MNIGIVGGGLFGRIIGLYLRSRRDVVTIFDAGLEHSGLSAAGCLIKPSWTAGIPRRDEALEMLDEIAGIRAEQFRMLGVKLPRRDPVYVLNKDELIRRSDQAATWVRDRAKVLDGRRVEADGIEYCFDRVICCMGSWGPHSYPKYGISFEIDGDVTDPAIKPWRPFTQLVRFNIRPDRVWAGDGTALKEWDHSRTEECWQRVSRFVQPKGAVTAILGRRPYAYEKLSTPCGLKVDPDGVIHVYGGGKNGSIGAAYSALEIVEYINA